TVRRNRESPGSERGMMQFDVKSLRVSFPDSARKRLFKPVPMIEVLHGVSFQVARGDSIGIVGESGSGKSTLARALLRLSETSGGSICFEGQELIGLSEHELRPLRRRMQIIFQDSQSALNPRLTVGSIVAE